MIIEDAFQSQTFAELVYAFDLSLTTLLTEQISNCSGSKILCWMTIKDLVYSRSNEELLLSDDLFLLIFYLINSLQGESVIAAWLIVNPNRPWALSLKAGSE